MFEFLSYGAGVNSTAAMVLLRPKHLIFADTGDEHPDTYGYIEEVAKPFAAAYGAEFITVRNPKFQRLRDEAIAEHIIPVRINRWCTDKFKIRPIRAYLKNNNLLPATQMIAIDAHETHRAKASGNSLIANSFPLIDRQLDREGCKRIINEAGLPLPIKSGCFYCPFQSKSGWISLKREHPDLFAIAVQIERNGSKFPQMFLAGDAPLEDHIRTGRIRYDEDQSSLFRCACYDGHLEEAP